MDIIHLLPDSVANQIAAGEVVQRPASVIKELMENAVDAGASTIDVLVQDAGRTSIQVIDDGKGMTETDARMAFERHATSKIAKAEDLFTLQTMGFRGEALPSIAAVSQVKLTTSTAEQELGVQLCLEGSRVVSQEVCSCPVGANFEVSNLFFNVPARRKFLKSNQTELNNIIQDFERIALVNPSVAFTLSSNGNWLMQLPAGGSLQRIVGIFGKRLGEQLLPLQVETSLVKISGFVGKPEAARKKGASQYLFVNGRFMRHPRFHYAVMEAFSHLIPEGDQVPYFIFFQVDPANIDVNIHPTKTEIKFENEQSIWQILAAAVKESLGKFNAIPSIDFDMSDMPDDLPVFNPANRQAAPPKVHVNPHYNPFEGQDNEYRRQSADEQWEKLYQGLHLSGETVRPPVEDVFAEVSQTPKQEDKGILLEVKERASSLMQYKGRYILTSVKSGLMLIDQHRAHVRVLFEQYMNQVKQEKSASQGLLFPEIVQLAPSEAAMLESILVDLSAVGFELTSLGGGSYAINGVPAGIEGLNPVELVHSMVNTALEKGSDVKEEVQQTIALTLAQAAAIVYGQVLTAEEMTDLVDRLFALSTPAYTPDGHPVIATISDDEIGSMFK